MHIQDEAATQILSHAFVSCMPEMLARRSYLCLSDMGHVLVADNPDC